MKLMSMRHVDVSRTSFRRHVRAGLVLIYNCCPLHMFMSMKTLFKMVTLVGWLFLGLTARRDGISVYIGPSPRERKEEKRNDRRD